MRPELWICVCELVGEKKGLGLETRRMKVMRHELRISASVNWLRKKG